MHERRARDPYVNLGSTCISKHLNDICDSCSSYDRVIDHDDSLALYRRYDRIELDPYGLLSKLLGRLYESPSYVVILNETLYIGDTRLL